MRKPTSRDLINRGDAAPQLAAPVVVLIYVPFGVFHLAAPDGFFTIMPPRVPYPREVVLITGPWKVAGSLAGAAMALYALTESISRFFKRATRVCAE